MYIHLVSFSLYGLSSCNYISTHHFAGCLFHLTLYKNFSIQYSFYNKSINDHSVANVTDICTHGLGYLRHIQFAPS